MFRKWHDIIMVVLLLVSGGIGCSLRGSISSSGDIAGVDSEKVTISGLSLGAIPSGVSTAPTLTVTDVTSTLQDQDDVALQFRMIGFDGNPETDWQEFTSGDNLGGVSLQSNKIYYYEVRGKTLAGGYSVPVRSGGWVPDSENCKEERLTDQPFANSQLNVDGLTEPTAFEICTPWQLNNIGQDAAHYDKYFKIKANLDMSLLTEPYRIIGDDLNRFTGIIDGENRMISNLTINEPARDDVGFVGSAASPFKLINMRIYAADVVGGGHVGILLGVGREIFVDNIQTAGRVRGDEYVGGVVGAVYWGTHLVKASSSADVAGAVAGGAVGFLDFDGYTAYELSASGNVTGTSMLGGLVGNGSVFRIADSYATGNVTGSSQCGGLLGAAMAGGFQRVYATGNVECPNGAAGGLAGHIWGAGPREMEDAYALGNVTGGNRVGGLIGYFNTASNIHPARRLYASGNVVGTDEVGGLIGRTELLFGGGSLTIRQAFAVGNVTGASSSDYVGLSIGRATNASLNQIYFDSAKTCINSLGSGSCSSPAVAVGMDTSDISVGADYFFKSTSSPLSLWNFSTIWQSHSDKYPTLRSVPF